VSTDLDVVITGGGVQGLAVLDALTERGYACALVHDGPLGAGQVLLDVYPRLLDVHGHRLGCYAGYRQDIGDQPGIAMCEMVEETTNILLAHPSGNVAAWLNAARIEGIASGLVDPSGAQFQLPDGGTGVEVGCAVEDRADFHWLTPDQWLLRYADPR